MICTEFLQTWIQEDGVPGAKLQVAMFPPGTTPVVIELVVGGGTNCPKLKKAEPSRRFNSKIFFMLQGFNCSV